MLIFEAWKFDNGKFIRNMTILLYDVDYCDITMEHKYCKKQIMQLCIYDWEQIYKAHEVHHKH